MKATTQTYVIALVWALALGGSTLATDLAPIQTRSGVGVDDPRIDRYSDRTLLVGLVFDRDGVEVSQFSVKPIPFETLGEEPPTRPYERGKDVQLEIRLIGPGGYVFTRRVDAGPVCMDHHPLEPSHIEGDRIVVHREGYLVALPELSGFDLIEVSWIGSDAGRAQPRSLGSAELTEELFDAAGGPLRYADVAFAPDDATSIESPVTSRVASVQWPEQLGDTDIYQVYGDETQVGERMNIVLVPDGYSYADKATLETHAQSMVNFLRQKTPYKEHDPFINYILVYAYSLNSGTDQCDCGIVLDTAMGTSFPSPVPTCGDSGNRCLYYHSNSCDTYGITNILAAEARAPDVDESIILVNTSRYGGCGGARSVYSAGNAAATEIAAHELGHSAAGLADEYGGNASCGPGAGGINTSTDPIDGSWPEWTALIGPPVEGGQYYDQCVFRPRANCDMRSLNQPFCEVCNQHYALTWFGFPAVKPTAPVRSYTPASSLVLPAGVPQIFSLETRFGLQTTNSIVWTVAGPGFPSPTVVNEDRETIPYTFNEPGTYRLDAKVIADTNFIRPERYGSNVDLISWTIEVTCASVEGPVDVLEVDDNGGNTQLNWSPVAGVDEYALTRGSTSALSVGDFGSCLNAMLTGTSYLDLDEPVPGESWLYLLQPRGACGLGSSGNDSSGNPRTNVNPAACM